MRFNSSLEKEEEAKDKYRQKVENTTFKVVIYMFVIFLALMLPMICLNVSHVTIDGDSMYPNLKNGENYMYYRPNRFMPIKRGDIISFKADECDSNMKYNSANANSHTNYIKRVIAIPGDTVTYDEGKLYVNGKEINQDYLTTNNIKQTKINTNINNLNSYQANHWNLKMLSNMTNVYGVTAWNKYSYHLDKNQVPPNCYFVLGDNRSISNDSRNWGFVPIQAINGVLIGTHKTHENNVTKEEY